MKTLSRHEMKSILGYLDSALKSTRAEDAKSLILNKCEGNASWNIRMARDRLLDAALVDVEVEPVEVRSEAA